MRISADLQAKIIIFILVIQEV